VRVLLLQARHANRSQHARKLERHAEEPEDDSQQHDDVIEARKVPGAPRHVDQGAGGTIDVHHGRADEQGACRPEKPTASGGPRRCLAARHAGPPAVVTFAHRCTLCPRFP